MSVESQTPEIFQYFFTTCPGILSMYLTIHMLYIRNDQVCIPDHIFCDFPVDIECGFQACVYPRITTGFKKLPGKITLHQRISAGNCDPASGSFIVVPVLFDHCHDVADGHILAPCF